MDTRTRELMEKFREMYSEDVGKAVFKDGDFFERLANLAQLKFDLGLGEIRIPAGGGTITIPPEPDKKIVLKVELVNKPAVAHALASLDMGTIHVLGHRRPEQSDLDDPVVSDSEGDAAPDGQMNLDDVPQDSDSAGEPEPDVQGEKADDAHAGKWYMNPTLAEVDGCLDPHVQGFQAAAAGVGVDRNPYETDSENYDRWKKGEHDLLSSEEPVVFWKCENSECAEILNVPLGVTGCPICGELIVAFTPWYLDVEGKGPDGEDAEPYQQGYQAGLVRLTEKENPYVADVTRGGKPKKTQDTDDGKAWEAWCDGNAAAIACNGEWWIDADSPFDAATMGAKAHEEGETIKANPVQESSDELDEQARKDWNKAFSARLSEHAKQLAKGIVDDLTPDAEEEAGEPEDEEPEPEDGESSDDKDKVTEYV